ncbi:MAG TPA: MFS transporter [Candidatus Mediterraneibacter cottocaccae]|nr:MFS transporter [Candidatus Mediterraneibacter cottocaccae]
MNSRENSKAKSIWDLPLLSTRIRSANVKFTEMLFGYFVGPLGVLIMTTVVSTYYLTFYRTYADIVSQGSFLTLLPLISVIPMVLANIIIGILIGRTKTSQGKARPYLITAAPLLLVSGILVFFIPDLPLGPRMVWMAVTYNLFAAIASPMYSSPHYLMVSLSTRNLKQRGTLSVVSNIPAVAANGLISSIVMPLILSWIKAAGSAARQQGRWQTVMAGFSVIAFFACLLEYFFTRERITEESTKLDIKEETIPAAKQLKAAMKDKYWWIIMIFYALYQSGVMFKGGFIFNIYCNEFFFRVNVLGMEMNGEMVQSVLALISGIPLAAGMLFIWPLANRFGKRNMVIAGLVSSIIGSIICVSSPASFWVVLVGQTFKGIGSIPGAYIMMALFADVLDHLEARFGFRCDGVSMSVYTAVLTVVNGLAVAFFLFFYDNSGMNPAGVAEFFFVGFEIFAHAALIILLLFLNVEKNIGEEQKQILERQKAAVIASGGVWIEPEERERLEQEKADREAEEARKRELQEYCRKKGLSFEEEERKYQEKKVRKKGKK